MNYLKTHPNSPRYLLFFSKNRCHRFIREKTLDSYFHHLPLMTFSYRILISLRIKPSVVCTAKLQVAAPLKKKTLGNYQEIMANFSDVYMNYWLQCCWCDCTVRLWIHLVPNGKRNELKSQEMYTCATLRGNHRVHHWVWLTQVADVDRKRIRWPSFIKQEETNCVVAAAQGVGYCPLFCCKVRTSEVQLDPLPVLKW